MRFTILVATLSASALFGWLSTTAESLAGMDDPTFPKAYRSFATGDKARLTHIWGTPEQQVLWMQRMAYAPGGKFALVASNDPSEKEPEDTVTLYDIGKRSARRALNLQKSLISVLVLAPDGNHALAASFTEDKGKATVTLWYWNLETGKVIHEFKGPKEVVVALAISQDGNTALSGSVDGSGQVWDLKAGKLVHTLDGQARRMLSVAISPDGSHALTAGQTGPLKWWDLKTGKLLKTLETNQVEVTSLAFLPDGDRFVTVDQAQVPLLWSIKANKEVRRFQKEPRGSNMTPLALSADGKHLVALRTPFNQARNVFEQFVTCWEVETGKEQWTAAVDLKIPTPLAFSADGKTVLLGGGESCFSELDAVTGKEIRVWGGHRGAVTQLALEPKSGRIWTASQDKMVKCWSPDGAELFTLKGHEDVVTGLAVIGDTLLTASNDKTLKLWALGTDKLVQKMTGHAGGITSLAVSKNGKIALTGSSDRSLKLWNLTTGKEVKTVTGHSDSVTAVALSPDGKWAASGSVDTTVRVWYLPKDGNDVEPIVLNGHTREVTAVAFLPDGKHLLSASQDQTLKLWNLDDEKEVRSFKGHKNWITALALSSDGKLAVTASDDLTLKWWDVATGKEMGSLDLGTAADVAKCVALMPDGRAFLTGTANWLVLRFELVR
jgi:WD40 repeat protein